MRIQAIVMLTLLTLTHVASCGTLYKKLIVAKILPRHHQFVFAFNENWILCNVISFLT